MPATVADLIAECLADAGISTWWTGPRAPATPAGIRSLALGTDDFAALVADAHGVVGPAPGAALLSTGGPGGEPLLRISARFGARPTPRLVDDPADLPALVRAAVDESAVRPGCVALVLAFELDRPAPREARPLPPARPALGLRLDVAEVDGPILVVAGGGVVRSGVVESLRRLVERAGLGVFNTWSAIGVLPSTDPYRLGTAGLQAWDFDLAGVGEAELLIASGIDPAEVPRYRWAIGDVVEVAPWELHQVADRWHRATQPPPVRPPLSTRLAEALAPHHEGRVSGSPAAAVLELEAALPPGGVLAADPGPAGLWVARTFSAQQPGTVVVPAVGDDGFAAAAALAAIAHGRPAIGVTTEPEGDRTAAVREEAARLGLPLDLRVWGPATGVDFAHTAVLEEIAGPVVAWT